jgi:hypothetical protein
MQSKAIPPHLKPENKSGIEYGEFEVICKSCKKLNNGCSPKDDFTICPVPENYEAK